VNGEYKMQGGNVRVKHFFNDSKGNQVFVWRFINGLKTMSVLILQKPIKYKTKKKMDKKRIEWFDVTSFLQCKKTPAQKCEIILYNVCGSMLRAQRACRIGGPRWKVGCGEDGCVRCYMIEPIRLLTELETKRFGLQSRTGKICGACGQRYNALVATPRTLSCRLYCQTARLNPALSDSI
jgi:hypothetical protein